VLPRFFFVVVAWVIFAVSSASTGKPTEKTYARLTCGSFLVIATQAAQENNSVFEIGKLNSKERTELLALSQSWHNGADFFIRTNFTVQGSAKKIVIVSNWELNTTKPIIWNFFRKNPAHIVGYSNRMIGFISPKEFADINLNGFVSVVSLATNSALNIFK